MKKQLLACTALVAAAMFATGGAVAAEKKKMMEPSISVSGYAEHIVGGVFDSNQTSGGMDATPDYAALDTRNDVEVHFTGRAELENGIKITAQVQLEGSSHTGAPTGVDATGAAVAANQTAHNQPSAANSDDQIDEMFLAVSGGFGQVILGPTENVVWKMLVGSSGSWATNVGWNQTFNSPSFVGAADPSGGAFHTTRMPIAVNGDSEKISYISPRFGGVQVGVSFTPNDAEDQHANTAGDRRHDGLAGAVSYSGKFGDVGVGGGVGYSNMQAAADGGEDATSWSVAGRLDFGGGFRVSVAYRQTESPDAAQGYVVDGGVRFVTGANQFSVSGSQGENTVSGNDLEYSTVMGSYARTMGSGVKVFTSLIFNDSQNADRSTERSGTVGIVGIRANF